MKEHSDYGTEIASKWTEILNESIVNELYPTVHPIGRETFSLYKEFPTGVFEYALDIDGATTFIREKAIEPLKVSPAKINEAVDPGNINQDSTRIKPNHKNPVMVLQSEFLTDNKPFCINGNHRIFETNRSNNPEIEVFYFRELEFIHFFYDRLSQATYYLEIDFRNVMIDKRELLNKKNDAFAYKFIL
ncbi:hypothetical protein ACFFJI_11605 [Allobacillus sp. GCM10007491]|uniref:Uncharacterized protein n=1 Tax=Allobacillus saliphilus TaxID=2912308 RepID=A0A941CTN5_9BACI|nr:hypothetical protein [Allobacillus saliphilus]MBR7553632.1 hypothetical protein [Allobacillus saliphilus]